MTIADLATEDLLIGGRWTGAAGDRRFDRLDPFSGERATSGAAASAQDAQRAVDAAAAAFGPWSRTAAAERRRVLLAAAENLERRAIEVAEAMTAEVGATTGWAMFNCEQAGIILREAAAQAHAVDARQLASDTPGLTSLAVRRPAGVVVGMAPWNAPLILAARAVATPLAFGNTVVLKGSEQCPRVHAEVARAVHEAGVADGVINYLTHTPADAPAVVETLIAHPAVRRVNFTGSTRVGRAVAHLCAEHLKPSLLELGGKASLIVLEDADLEEVAASVTFGAFMNAGQICMSTERVLAHRSIVGALERRLAEAAARLSYGDPRDPETVIGPVVDDASRVRILELIADARQRGARILCGGTADANVIAPTVVADVDPSMRLYREESFGPVLTVIPVADAEQAIAVANDTEYGLSAAVFGRDVTRALAVAAQIDSGMCHVNSATVQDEPYAPFGGVKHSGWGRFGGHAALQEFTELHWTTVQSGTRHYPI
jgi:acyl-CoA reductase-like NAD-dependent aldehyde dehydrogenase